MSETDAQSRKEINAEPTKTFFVDMLTRDIPLEQAVLDLVDNCVDGAKRIAASRTVDPNHPYDGCRVQVDISSDRFSISDNCGGFDVLTAREYAFRFGRPAGAARTSHSIGQFGVGMKRALFKFGRHFTVESATTTEAWAVDVDVDEWEHAEGWSFPWAEPQSTKVSRDNPGTEITVTNLRREVSAKFSTTHFINSITGLIKSKHRQFIADGLEIKVNGSRVDATNIYLLVGEGFTPGTDILEFTEEGQSPVTAKIIVGLGKSSPKEAGWNVICNGRVVLEADRRTHTAGWGLFEENAQKMIIPSFHNQFARFRGIVSFESDDSSRVPWNTTKTDVDADSNVWRATFQRMLEMMRPVIDFLNELDADIDENTKEKSPLLEFVTKAVPQGPETFHEKRTFTAPNRESVVRGPKMVKIQFSRTLENVEFLQDALGVTSAKAVGETCFDMILARQRD
ncbi:ATP-binding protein [Pseudomonas sp. PDNC002]|uniref:ATP-binding protein n=1 Tax=Pseudomonas sp. PDNC002 TaxID=2811422 RepID=UPI0019651C3B|nr:ATP-binding protein [Pseudomonas sp. PDNC002]QRY79661.1 ATP-binding protein [Pseudomonas sp. PDNC002]